MTVVQSISMPRTLHHPGADTLELTGVLHALADPMRLEIVRALAAEGECRCGAFDLPVDQVDAHAPLPRAARERRDRAARRGHGAGRTGCGARSSTSASRVCSDSVLSAR